MSEHVERTFVALKPDAVKRGLVGKITARFEEAGFKICGMKMVQATDQLLEKHYKEHVDKPFYDGLAEYMKQGPIVAIVLEGVHAAKNLRKIVGETDATEAHPATVRGQFGHMSMEHADSAGRHYKNLVHASEPEEAEREIEIWFDEDELYDYQTAQENEVR
ncbi:nucleoside-diphosphate kinase [Candidatus Nanohalococcus occultus]|uniref:nucleoside-diphosphate kinase n=1 Tax=Candidatus Nanohalococcus occultus TaxID=2978047 RepID=A0ABY8CIR2_9ARCH|nr:Nucleoside diphosphate kinase [Candidatus Nanohaloarchaeota archaeon SVXNc]